MVKIGESSAKALIPILRDAIHGHLKLNYFSTRELIRALGTMRSRDAVPVLIDCLSKGYMATAVIDALGDIGDDRAIDPLISHLDSADGHAHDVAQSFRKIGKAAVQKGIAALRDAAGRRFWMLGRALCSAGYSPTRAEDAADFYLATQQWGRLVEIGEPSVTTKMTVLVQNTGFEDWELDREIRINIVETLGQIGGPKAIESLSAVLSDYAQPEGIRCASAAALGRIGKAAIRGLVTFLEAPSDPRSVEIEPSTKGLFSGLCVVGSSYAVEASVLRALGLIGEQAPVEAICTSMERAKLFAQGSEDDSSFVFIGYHWTVLAAFDALGSIFGKGLGTEGHRSRVVNALAYWISYQAENRSKYRDYSGEDSVRLSAKALYDSLR